MVISYAIFKGLPIMISEGQAIEGTAATSKNVDAGDNVSQHWQGSPPVGIQVTTGGETVKQISSLFVVCGAKGNGAGGSVGHGIGVFLMYLDIGTKFEAAVF
jgi:hypothetical protein